MTKLSFVIPVYNSESSIELTIQNIQELMAGKLGNYSYEIVMANDGSTDNSDTVCREILKKHEHLKYIQLSRNFSQHNALIAGFNHVDGDLIVSMDDDLQVSADDVLLLLEKLERDDLDVVYGNYENKKHSVFRNLSGMINQKMSEVLLNKPSDIKLTSFYILKRYVVDEITRYKGSFPYMGGLILRSTNRIGTVKVAHLERKFGKSNYTFQKLFSLWFNGFTNFSTKPLRFISASGLFFFVLSFVFIVFLVIKKMTNPGTPIGWTSTLLSIFAFGGLQLAAIGFVGEYIGRVFLSLNKTPQYIVRAYLESVEADD